jgi:hypothetical protein
MRKYGGAEGLPLDQIPEAECYVTPPRTYSTFEKLMILPVGIIKLLPITLLLMAVMWGVSVLIVGL